MTSMATSGAFTRLLTTAHLQDAARPVLLSVAGRVDELIASGAEPAQCAGTAQLLLHLARGLTDPRLDEETIWTLEALVLRATTGAPALDHAGFVQLVEDLLNRTLLVLGVDQVVVGLIQLLVAQLAGPPSRSPQTSGGDRPKQRKKPVRNPHDYQPPPCPTSVDEITELIGSKDPVGSGNVVDEDLDTKALPARLREDLGPTDSCLWYFLKAAARQGTVVNLTRLGRHMLSSHVVPLRGIERLEKRGLLHRDKARNMYVLKPIRKGGRR